ncbi:hypothetical protein CAPTEDRAFT_140385 [Capitella teleta]|uniref:Uncharacterized protein n=1 Tax=Capitella teleta TaxID=283909 RepID=R7UJL0_CAPTE|nr:hypothetical protein CAPTEDRAFT_140385 [Capitella teleta]|eukprot:ELU06303.1 hypothetical protein CAPTEDRAFT_140385 [Capitella teleta]
MTSSQKAIKAALIDLSGTIHIEDEAIPGAQGALQKLVPVLFILEYSSFRIFFDAFLFLINTN